jgi:hypothetical protein
MMPQLMSNFRSNGRAGSTVPLLLFVAARRSPRLLEGAYGDVDVS